MKLKPYPKYKDSGIEWLGKVPEEWSVKSVWHIFSLGRGRVISHELITDNPGDYPVYSSQTEDHGILGYLDSFDFEGDYITWTTDGANAGTVFRRLGQFNCTNVCGTLKAKYDGLADNAFMAYSLSNTTAEFVRYDINPKLMNNVMASIKVPCPSIIEQHAIASFLDWETARIDALIQKKERMIELLKEKRIALITQAVTKGLDPNVPMKDSGIEWLGEVPEHWTVLKFKNIGSFQGGAGFPDDEQGLEDEEIPFYKVSDMNLPSNETYMCQHNNSVSRETALKLRASILRKNTIVFAKVGAALLLNRRRIITKDSCIDNNMMGFSTTHCDVMWCYFFLFQLDLGKLVNPGAVPSVNESQMSNIPVCVPPTQEQKQIGDYLVTETTKINKMIDKVNASIIQLSEYRASLIHHAVTGKIDLRDYDAQAQ